MSDLENAQKALKEYLASKKKPVLPPETERFDVWRAVFQDHLNVWADIALEDERRAADLASKEATVEPTVVGITAMLAHTRIRHYTEDGLSGGNFRSNKHRKEWETLFKSLCPQVIKFWLEAMKPTGKQFYIHLKDYAQRYGCEGPLLEIIEEYLK